VSLDPAIWSISTSEELERGGARNREVRSHEVIRALHEGGHLVEYVLVQRLSIPEVLWRSVSEFPEASDLKALRVIDPKGKAWTIDLRGDAWWI
jgi:hypothetical protein